MLFFVTDASGAQGGAAVHQLLSSGHKVNALARDLSKPSSQRLASLGANLIKGDYDDKDALTAAAEDELRHASNIIKAAKNAGAKKIVYWSASRAEEHEISPTWDPNDMQGEILEGKYGCSGDVEVSRTQLDDRAACLDHDELDQSFFCVVLARISERKSHEDGICRGYAGPSKESKRCGNLCIEGFGGRRFGRGDGEIMRLAGESLTIGQIAEMMIEISGKQVKVKNIDEHEREKTKGMNPMIASQDWQRLDGTKVYFDKVESYALETTSFTQCLQANKEALVAVIK